MLILRRIITRSYGAFRYEASLLSSSERTFKQASEQANFCHKLLFNDIQHFRLIDQQIGFGVIRTFGGD